MSALAVNPELLSSAAAEVENLGSLLDAARSAAAVRTVGLAPAAADEVSAAVSALFGAYGREFQELSAQATAFGRQFAQTLTSSAGSFAAAETADVSLLQQAQRGLEQFAARQLSIYDLRDWRGWAALLLDYSWGLPGTTLGYGLQLVNAFHPTAVYDAALSRQVGWHVYRGGVGIPGFITTLGNVTTHLGPGSGSMDVLINHEAVHLWQSRIFGPLFQASYVGWLAGGALVGTGYWLLHPEQDWFSLVETAAYYDNPWEVAAYVNDNNWPPSGANPALLWKLPDCRPRPTLYL